MKKTKSESNLNRQSRRPERGRDRRSAERIGIGGAAADLGGKEGFLSFRGGGRARRGRGSERFGLECRVLVRR